MKKRIDDAARRAVTMLLVAVRLMAGEAPPAHADGKTRLAKETADYLMQRFGRQVVKEGVESLAARIETYAARHGDGFYAAVRRVGPSAFRLVEEAGGHAPQGGGVLCKIGGGAGGVGGLPRAG